MVLVAAPEIFRLVCAISNVPHPIPFLSTACNVLTSLMTLHIFSCFYIIAKPSGNWEISILVVCS
jgi:hypothetical protein